MKVQILVLLGVDKTQFDPDACICWMFGYLCQNNPLTVIQMNTGKTDRSYIGVNHFFAGALERIREAASGLEADNLKISFYGDANMLDCRIEDGSFPDQVARWDLLDVCEDISRDFEEQAEKAGVQFVKFC